MLKIMIMKTNHSYKIQHLLLAREIFIMTIQMFYIHDLSKERYNSLIAWSTLLTYNSIIVINKYHNLG